MAARIAHARRRDGKQLPKECREKMSHAEYAESAEEEKEQSGFGKENIESDPFYSAVSAHSA
jgi:hypothetical protein